MSAIEMLTEEELCASCGQRPRLPGVRSTWCRECKNQWQREYRAGIRRFRPVPPPVRVGTCLIWQGAVNPDTGYGHQTRDGVNGYAHRWAWEDVHGPIPSGLTIDHLADRCSSKLCVEVSHMELVTRGENTRRAWAGRRTGWCERHGRDMDRTTPKGRRYCSLCVRESNARRRR